MIDIIPLWMIFKGFRKRYSMNFYLKIPNKSKSNVPKILLSKFGRLKSWFLVFIMPLEKDLYTASHLKAIDSSIEIFGGHGHGITFRKFHTYLINAYLPHSEVIIRKQDFYTFRISPKCPKMFHRRSHIASFHYKNIHEGLSTNAK